MLGGAWELDVPDAGGMIGRPLTTTLMPPRQVQVDGELRCQLRAIARTSRGGGSVEVKTLWQTQWTQPASTVHPKMGIAIILPLPARDRRRWSSTGEPPTTAGN